MTDEKRPLKVFLCHAHSDKGAVFALYDRLTKDGVDVWLDKKSLLPGQEWEYEIRKAVRESDVVVVCLSNQFNQAGFRQKEVHLALDTAMEKPEGEIFIVPARLEECDTLDSLRKWHWVDLFEDDGYEMLIRALRTRANRIGTTLQINKGWLPIGMNTQPPAIKKPVPSIEKPVEEDSKLKKKILTPKEIIRNIIGVIGFVILVLVSVFGLVPLIGRSEPTSTATNTASLKTPTPDSANKIPILPLQLHLSAQTPTPTQVLVNKDCDYAQFVADVNFPDGTTLVPGEKFTKTWRVKNAGTCTWSTEYAYVFVSGEIMADTPVLFFPQEVPPGQNADVMVDLQAPSIPGTYKGYWQFRNAAGGLFGIGSTGTKPIWLEIRVVSKPRNITYDFVANMCFAKWKSGAGELPCPSTDGDVNGFVLKDGAPKFESGIIEENPGLIVVPQNVYNGYIQGSYPAYTVKKGDHFRSKTGCAYNATSCYVSFRLDYAIAGTSDIKTFWAFNNRYDGLTYDANIDLSSLAGQDVVFILTINASGYPTGDRAIWGAPMIVNAP